MVVTALLEAAERDFAAYEHDGNIADLQKAQDGFAVVLDMVGIDTDLRGAACTGLGNVLWSRFELDGRSEHLDRAIACFDEALTAFDGYDQVLPAVQNDLAGALLARSRLPDASDEADDDLSRAIRTIRAALAATRPYDLQRHSRTNSLADALFRRYVRHRDSSDLTESIGLYERVVDSARPTSDTYVIACSNLAEALRSQSLAA
ncbi:MAG TPA: hypothetical protein VI076_17550, partial [Actinopolymorphaceae bacterium]